MGVHPRIRAITCPSETTQAGVSDSPIYKRTYNSTQLTRKLKQERAVDLQQFSCLVDHIFVLGRRAQGSKGVEVTWGLGEDGPTFRTSQCNMQKITFFDGLRSPIVSKTETILA